MSLVIPYIHRDISWLSFNYRVLQEAKDKNVPLLERIKFLAIYSSNLDEYFKVRVANHRTLARAGKKAKKSLTFEPELILAQVLKIVNEQQVEFSRIFRKEIIPELKENGINILKRKHLNEEQTEFIETFFKDNLLPYVQPVLLVEDKIKPFLTAGSLHLVLHMKEKNDPSNEDKYAIVNIPSDHIQRFIILPSQKDDEHDIILLDDLVRHSIRILFPGYDIQDSFSIKLTRDADLYIDDEFEGDLIEKIKKGLNKRNVGPASRLVYDREIPTHLLSFLKNTFDLSKFDLLPEGRYHNNSDFFGFPIFSKYYLQNTTLEPLAIPQLQYGDSIFPEISKKDYLINVPYHSYESVIKFFEDAAIDPAVTHIKIVQYRVARKSRIMQALIKAVQQGKQVSTFIEIKARFDEEANLIWAERLEKAGVNVHYSMPGLKVHSKVALVRRIEDGEAKIYCYLSTGNFHESTAKIYSDFGLFTADPRITKEVARLFIYLETQTKPTQAFEHLAVGQFNLNQVLDSLITAEVENAEQGKKAQIILKMNSLQDKEMVKRLYEASQKGVEIILIIRGICSLIPGINGVSDNIRGISIVDRYLEHARVFIFHNDDDPKYYLSSADWMSRNLHRRIETIFPIYDPDIKKTIQDTIDIQLNDNVKARHIKYKHNNEYIKNGEDISSQSQVDTYYYFKRRLESSKNIEEAVAISDDVESV